VQTVGNPRKRSELVEGNCQLSILCQCRLLNIYRSLVYYRLSGESAENLCLMRQMDVLLMEDPSVGSKRLSRYLTRLICRSISRKGRWGDNVVNERFWRTIKYEEIYLQLYCRPNELERGIENFMLRYNAIRPVDPLGGEIP